MMDVQPILHPEHISMREGDLFVQTRFYRHDKSAGVHLLMLVGLIAVMFMLLAFAESKAFAVVFVIILFALPIIASKVKTIFSFNAVDDRFLIMERQGVQVGDDFFRIREIEGMVLHIDTFYGFRCPGRYRKEGVGYESEYGDRSLLSFRVAGKTYSYRFLLGTGTAWLAMYQLIEAWAAAGLPIKWSERLPKDVVLDAIRQPHKLK